VLPKFQRFIHDRQYLPNVSPATVEWHTHALTSHIVPDITSAIFSRVLNGKS
jgi:hypothetical protein